MKGRPNYYSRTPEEFAHITFDLTTDLSPLFTWNTKQVFLYITTTYPASPSSPSQKKASGSKASTAPKPDTTAVLWDAILQHPLAPVHVNHFDPSNPTGRKPFTPSGGKKGKKNEPKEPEKAKSIADVAIIRLAGQKPKYQITDPTGRLAGRGNSSLQLNWNVQPWVGALTWGAGGLSPSPDDDVVGTKSERKSGGWFGHSSWWHTWRAIPGYSQTEKFDMPRIRNATEKKDTGTVKGREGHRLEVG